MERHRKAEKDKLLHTSLEEEGRGGRRRRSEEVGGRETRREAGGDGERNRSSERSRDGPSTLTQRVAHVAVDRNPGRSTVRSTRDGVSMCLLLLLLLACACCCCWSGSCLLLLLEWRGAWSDSSPPDDAAVVRNSRTSTYKCRHTYRLDGISRCCCLSAPPLISSSLLLRSSPCLSSTLRC